MLTEDATYVTMLVFSGVTTSLTGCFAKDCVTLYSTVQTLGMTMQPILDGIRRHNVVFRTSVRPKI